MILAFSGDPFLASRASWRALAARGFRRHEIHDLADDLDPETVRRLAAQSGLFGSVALHLDFGTAFSGQAGVKPRNEVLKILEEVPGETVVAVLDPEATAARQKTYRRIGEHEHLPTPRFEALGHWIRLELEAAGVRFRPGVPALLADLFGEDLPALAAEVLKLAVLDEDLDEERTRVLVNRPAARDAFDLIEAGVRGDAATALQVCRNLLAAGEPPPRVLGALSWQYNLVARCVALRESRARVDPGLIVQTLKVKPFVAKKALAIAARLDEDGLFQALDAILQADLAMKTGRDAAWALEALALRLARLFRAARS